MALLPQKDLILVLVAYSIVLFLLRNTIFINSFINEYKNDQIYY